MQRNRTFLARVTGAALISSSLLVAPALATSSSGFTPSGVVAGHFGTVHLDTSNLARDKDLKWSMMLKTTDDTDVGTDKLVVQPDGFSGWHTHPSAVFVTVTLGSIVWYNGSNPLCPSHTYSAGQSFIEEAYVIHNVKNASSSNTAEFYATHINPTGTSGPVFRLDRAKPNNCNF